MLGNIVKNHRKYIKNFLNKGFLTLQANQSKITVNFYTSFSENVKSCMGMYISLNNIKSILFVINISMCTRGLDAALLGQSVTASRYVDCIAGALWSVATSLSCQIAVRAYRLL